MSPSLLPARARAKRWLFALGWSFYVAAFVWPCRLDKSLTFGVGWSIATELPSLAFEYGRTRVASVLGLLTFAVPNVAVLTTPFAYRRRFGESLVYRGFLAAAAIDAIALRAQISPELLHGLADGVMTSVTLWLGSITLVAAAFLVDPAAVTGWPWSRATVVRKARPRAGAAPATPTRPGPSGEHRFDVFLSYASRADYELVRRLESFLETFHELETPDLPPRRLRVCTDLSEFRLRPGEGRRERDTPSRSVLQIVDEYVDASEHLLVLCCPEAVASPWVNHELGRFLERRGPDRVLLAVTGGDPETDPGRVFPAAIAPWLEGRPYYDLRRAYLRHRGIGSRAKNWDDERVRLAAELAGGPSAGQLQPIWHRERRARAIRWVLAGLAGLALTLGASWKLAELSLEVDAFDYPNAARRWHAIDALTRWFDYSAERAQGFAVRDDPWQFYDLLTLGCAPGGADAAAIQRVALALDRHDAEQRRGALRAVLDNLQITDPDFDSVRVYNSQPADTPRIDDVMPGQTTHVLDVPGPAPFRIRREPLSSAGRAELTLFEAFERAAGLSGHLPTAGELRRAYAAGLETPEAEWCRFGAPARACTVCLMVRGVETEVPLFEKGLTPVRPTAGGRRTATARVVVAR